MNIDTPTSGPAAKPLSATCTRGVGVKVELEAKPTEPSQVLRLHQAPRCGAKTRSGKPCQSPAMRGKARCRGHGGKAGAPPGERNGAYRHGLHTAEMVEARREIAMMNRVWRNLRKRL